MVAVTLMKWMTDTELNVSQSATCINTNSNEKNTVKHIPLRCMRKKIDVYGFKKKKKGTWCTGNASRVLNELYSITCLLLINWSKLGWSSPSPYQTPCQISIPYSLPNLAINTRSCSWAMCDSVRVCVPLWAHESIKCLVLTVIPVSAAV